MIFPRVKYKTKLDLIRVHKDGKVFSRYINPLPSYSSKDKTIYLIPNQNTIDSLTHELMHYFIDVISLNSICEKCTEKLELLLDHIDCWIYDLKQAKRYARQHYR